MGHRKLQANHIKGTVVTATIAAILLTVGVNGCSRKNQLNNQPATQSDAKDAADSASNAQPQSNSIAAEFSFVESAETQERNRLMAEAAGYFTNRSFDALEQMAARYRASKEGYADGTWKLGYVYAMEPAGDTTENDWTNRIAIADEWIRKKPQSMTARVAKARLLTGYAWFARGDGYADTVKEKQWAQFEKLINDAAKVLISAKNLRERCPLYWSTWQRTALGLQLGKKDYDALFQQAIKEFPEYSYFYCVRATYLLPRWFGQEGEWETDLTQYSDKMGGEAGDILYAQVVCDVHHYGGGIDVFESKSVSWDRVDRGLAGLLKKYPQSRKPMNERAQLAALAGDKEKARKYFGELKGQLDVSVWHDKEYVEQSVAWLNGK